MKNAIEIRKLKKKYDDNFELGEINLDIPSGYVIGLIGENGAGKTTLIKSILNIINIDSGDIKIFNKNNKDEYLVKEDIGVVLDGMFFPEIMTINDINIVMKSIYKNWDSELFNKYLRKFKLSKSKKIKELSKGMRKKLEIVTALSHHPKLLILDEPTSGLDPVVRNDILEIFLDFIRDEEHTILFSTHITSDLEHIADEIVFIDNGKVILNENKDELLDNYGALKCSIDSFSKIDKDDIIRYKKNKYNYEILVGDRNKISKKYKDCVVDKITLEDLMILVIKGEK
ncbi:MAG: ABC transporter ATP-binding protein [Tenericutes bacterium]|nr:ABC transporter ATP-binding protein [Mycoplasmatota bacterium]